MPVSHHVSVLTISALAVSSLILTTRPAAAQFGTLSLQSGDIVTVTGFGTVSNRLGGSNATSAYDAGNNLEAVDAEAGSTFNLAGGSVTGEDGDSAIFANSATITVTSGSVFSSGSGTDGVDASNSSTVAISGGSFRAAGGGANSGPAPLVSPALALSAVDVYADSKSRVTITGGLFSASGTGAIGLFAINGGVINLYGTGFSVSGSPATGSITTGSGTITGTLLNGSVLTNLPYTVLGGTILFTPAPAPEPSQSVTLGLAFLSLGGLALRARRRCFDA